MTCEHDWEMTDAEMTGWWMAGDTPEFSGTYRAVCTNCGETHEGDWDGQAPEIVHFLPHPYRLKESD